MTNVNPLATLPTGNALVQVTTGDVLAVSGSQFLPRFQVTQGMSKIVIKGLCPAAVFAIQYSEDQASDLGKEVDLVLLSVRTKALDTSGDNPTEFFDRNSTAFKDVAKRSAIKDSGCMYGPEFLVWIPNEGEKGTFASWFLGSKTGRREAPELVALMKDANGEWQTRAITSRIRMIPGGKYTWPGSSSVPCSTAFATSPDVEELQTNLSKFLNPPASRVEKATAEAQAAQSRAQ